MMTDLFRRFNFRKWIRDDRGTVAIMFAMAAIPLALAIGVALDHGSNLSKRTKLQTALDAGALAAAASELDDDARISLAKDVFYQNAGEMGGEVVPVFTIGEETVTGRAELKAVNRFMRVAGLGEDTLGADTTVRIPNDRPAEVALVLDYSSSMKGKGKWQAMRDASLSLVNTLSNDSTNTNVKFGLVPFSKMVVAEMPGEYVIDEDKTNKWTGKGCTQDRKWPYNIQDTTPNPLNEETKWGMVGQAKGTCHQMASHNLVIAPLTNDHQAIIDQLNAMDPYVGTHISLGLEFGWHLISPNPPFTEGVAYDDSSVLKVIVLLSDGRQTTKAWGPGDSYKDSNGEDNLEDMCEAIKQKDVMLVTIAFDLKYQETRDRLSNCATSPQYFFDADTNDQLVEAFEDIAKLIKGQIYVSK